MAVRKGRIVPTDIAELAKGEIRTLLALEALASDRFPTSRALLSSEA